MVNDRRDFTPLDDESLGLQVGDAEAIPAPKDSPGEPGSAVPGIEAFKDPASDPELAPIFEHIHFDYNSSFVKGDENLRILQNIASYMKSHPRLYIFVEGHCDKRGSAAYNFALGANRANAIRTDLVQDGVSPDHVFTISYGKEKPLFEEEGEEFHRLNRRAQFKVLREIREGVRVICTAFLFMCFCPLFEGDTTTNACPTAYESAKPRWRC